MVLGLNHIPAGMELFPASPQTPWKIIQRVIDLSDYYVLVVAGMYGSTDDNGISYTEKEYDYAHEQGKYVITLLHDSPGDIPSKNVETDESKREKLEAFIDRVKGRHTITTWKNADDLAGKVAQALGQAISESPAVGWVRADGIDNTDLLKKLTSALEEITVLRTENQRLQASPQAHSDSEARINAHADTLDSESIAWFLEMSRGGDVIPLSDMSEPVRISAMTLERDGLIHIEISGSSVVMQPGWALRDELLRREAIILCVTAPRTVAAVALELNCDDVEAERICVELLNRRLTRQYRTNSGDQFGTTAAGTVYARRLELMRR